MSVSSASPLRTFAPWLIAAVAAALVWWHAGIILPFVLSMVLAYALEPAVRRLQAWRLPRAVAVALCLFAVFLTVSVLVVLLVPIVSQLVPMIKAQLPDLLGRVWGSLAPWLAQLGLDLPASIDELKTELVALLQTHGAEWGSALWQSALVGGSSLVTLLGFALLVPMLAFYWLMDWARFTEQAWLLLPVRWRDGVRATLIDMDDLMGQYLRGQALVMLILAAYYSIGLSLFGFKLALPIGVFTGLAVCIPYLGFGLGLLLALVAGLLQFAPTEAGLLHPLIALVVVYGLGQVIESFFLTPRLVGERIGLHPLGVIFALMLFGQWMGFWGVVVALPCAACLTVLGRRALQRYRHSAAYQRAD